MLEDDYCWKKQAGREKASACRLKKRRQASLLRCIVIIMAEGVGSGRAKSLRRRDNQAVVMSTSASVNHDRSACYESFGGSC